MSVDEVNTIMGVNDFSLSDSNSWYYFETNTKSKQSVSGNGQYHWLHDYLDGCEFCMYQGSNDRGYWLKDVVGTAGSGADVWMINWDYAIYFRQANFNRNGIRSVITIEKSKVN